MRKYVHVLCDRPMWGAGISMSHAQRFEPGRKTHQAFRAGHCEWSLAVGQLVALCQCASTGLPRTTGGLGARGVALHGFGGGIQKNTVLRFKEKVETRLDLLLESKHSVFLDPPPKSM